MSGDRTMMDVINDIAAQQAKDNARNLEAVARALVVDSLPRGLKWFVGHPKLVRAYYRVRPSKHPQIVVWK